MYNKLFTKILDSSIWLEPTATRIVWLTLIAGMDEDGFVALASVANLAHRARVDRAEAEEAVRILEAPDPDSSDPEHEGRRIERTTGGWIVLNGPKYRDLVTRTVQREQTRARVAKHRAKKHGNAPVTEEKRKCNGDVTPSEAVTDTKTDPPKAPQDAAASPPLGAGKEKDVIPKSPEALAICELFNRKSSTEWDSKLVRKFKDGVRRGVITLSSIHRISDYYAAERGKGEEGRHRRDIGTFLNNFDGEIDRAEAFLSNGNGNHVEAPRGEFAKPFNAPPTKPQWIVDLEAAKAAKANGA